MISTLPTDLRIYFLDDHAPTAIAIVREFGEKIHVLVPLVPRNRNSETELRKLGIQCGTFDQLIHIVESIDKKTDETK